MISETKTEVSSKKQEKNKDVFACKILFSTPFYKPSIGGLESAIENLVCILKNKNIDINIIVSGSRSDLSEEEEISGVTIKRVVLENLSSSSVRCSRSFVVFFKSIANIKTFFKINRLILKFKPQIVNICFPITSDIYILALSVFYKIPIIVSLHGEVSFGVPYASTIEKILFKFLLKKSSYVIACSKYLLGEATKMVPSIANKSRYIYNGIPPDYFLLHKEPAESIHNNRYILTIANLWGYKGIDILLMAMRTVYDNGHDIDLIIVGDGDNKKQLITLSRALRIENKVIFKGSINNTGIKKELLRNCEFFVLPSRLEPFGIVNLEAMAAGKAIVCTRSGGLPEIVKDGINGILVEPFDDKALAESIMRLLDDKELRQELGRNGRKMVEDSKFSWDNIAKQYIEICKKVLHKK